MVYALLLLSCPGLGRRLTLTLANGCTGRVSCGEFHEETSQDYGSSPTIKTNTLLLFSKESDWETHNLALKCCFTLVNKLSLTNLLISSRWREFLPIWVRPPGRPGMLIETCPQLALVSTLWCHRRWGRQVLFFPASWQELETLLQTVTSGLECCNTLRPHRKMLHRLPHAQKNCPEVSGISAHTQHSWHATPLRERCSPLALPRAHENSRNLWGVFLGVQESVHHSSVRPQSITAL